MALFYYNATNCLDSNDTVCFSSSTQYNINDVFNLQDLDSNPVFGCYKITDELETCEALYSDLTFYNICEDCVSSTGGYYNLTTCIDNQPFYVDSSQFSFLPEVGKVYFINELCYGLSTYSDTPDGDQIRDANILNLEFDICEVCFNFLPTSAGTENNLCQEVCTSGGTTVVTINPPHPIWTNLYGANVTELSMVTIGGNGLNA
jgi:hypothetical protein